MRILYTILLLNVVCIYSYSQQAYFVDGYHGGIYGHYPVEWKTRFMVDKLVQHPEWKMCLEIEPETWDTVQARTPKDYHDLKRIVTDKRVEFTNPTYAQPYAYNISGESLIRQFEYGIKKTRTHFPKVEFTTYSVEEPCFTSSLPQILRQFGFKYAVLKNPNTCWGGYTRAYGGELVNWVGPDGTSILTVPRYACEELEENSTWQTQAWDNAESYLQACTEYGIEHPVGMCFQDAGWKNGPWLGTGKEIKNNSIYVTWKEYIENISSFKTNDNKHFTQEDILVSLMWGSQVLQTIAQQVRTSENRVVIAEKLGTLAHLENAYTYSQPHMDDAWRTLMMAQHHDSWIVPYNRLHKQQTWADAIGLWTGHTDTLSSEIIDEALHTFDLHTSQSAAPEFIRVYNTQGVRRKEMTRVLLPAAYAGKEFVLYNTGNKEIPCSIANQGEQIKVSFQADVPPFGYATYRIQKKKADTQPVSGVRFTANNECVIENDMYRIVLDASKGGTIKSLIAKQEGNKEFVDALNPFRFGELRGHFYEEGQFHSSTETPATIRVVEDNALQTTIQIAGEIASHPFTQTLSIARAQRRIDCALAIDWKNNVGIGEYKQDANWRINRRAFYDDRFKLNILFPAALPSAKIYKNAPFDVCESQLDNTFFNAWDEIKHNIILHWVDLLEPGEKYGMALLSDHTTSYSYGEDFPLGLTAQYSGIGLWGPDYKITRPLQMKYALVPHSGRWDKAHIATESNCWNEPLIGTFHSSVEMTDKSLLDTGTSGYEISAVKLSEEKIILRLFNAQGDESPQTITLGFPVSTVEEVDLNERTIAPQVVKKDADKNEIILSMPRFGLKTFIIKKEEN